jgi:hypothetical protein
MATAAKGSPKRGRPTKKKKGTVICARICTKDRELLAEIMRIEQVERVSDLLRVALRRFLAVHT